MKYWLNLFTAKTWAEFRDAGGKTSGFREHGRARASRVTPGDMFLCYLVGVKRWVGLLKIETGPFKDEAPIYEEEIFPVRFTVESSIALPPELGVPMESLAGKLSFFPLDATSRQWSGRVRGSLSLYQSQDGDAIAYAIRQASQNPVSRPVDPKQLERSANLYKIKPKGEGDETERVVRIPPKEEESEELEASETLIKEESTHTEIQWRLLDLGSQMGLSVWAPRADRGRVWRSNVIGTSKKILEKLPTQFNEATTKTIENIDVLWLSGQTIVAAFEVEHTTTVYSGLLRMSDLLTMQPNLDLKLFLVGPDDRYAKFTREIARPTFASRPKPLHAVCGFLPYSKLCARLNEAKNVIRFLKPEFIDEIAEFYDPAEDIV
ncbi:hypothetical protein [Paludisphaera borealis]|uniref:EVE domain-containing protein n=1 Tax=Paludisphaera borealis TaxID=1387353 RepID=A0A1U7CIU5_9BACT|nr:hypothetical protein [Paludisphaera borealis]APW58827.1 hypothetical protein BSF38_00231 [Paludisphaera borealis]